ncbi:hypothetical protein MYU51_019195 [Penicillium brevicompactum]|uniref:uncharacterized protein n=1 Tax=Penicillium brevicompactum TaxID=5074 RepID=UPI0025415008|nr:uncharacterized protein N7506_006231 [Penicillium brevicompactum]KAJ5332448.1 hypothetical protein N7506_006231 [Penicillium brevicompactum]
MRRYQQHTHASWHRAYEGKAECPWCHEGPREESRPQSSRSLHKRVTKRPDTNCTNRTDAPSPRATRSRAQSIKQSDQSMSDQTAQFEPHSDPAPDTTDDAEDSPELNSHYTKYMGRTVRHENGVFALEPPRPRLPEEWTQENEEPDTGSRDWNESPVETWRSGLDTAGDYRDLDEEKAGLVEPDVKELENV